MAGHSKFKNIMHKKGAADKKKAALFTRLAREIQMAAKTGGADLGGNPRLARAIAAARAENMPKDNIQRAVDKGVGGGGGDLEEIRYEGFGPAGVGVIIEAATDNKNRTAGEVRAAFNKNGGNLGEQNSVSFGWERVGEVRYPLKVADPEAMLEAAVEAGAEDCAVEEGEDGDEHVITCAMPALNEVAAALAGRFGDAAAAKFVWRPQVNVPVEGEALQTLLKLLDALDDLDDVQAVYANFEADEAALAG